MSTNRRDLPKSAQLRRPLPYEVPKERTPTGHLRWKKRLRVKGPQQRPSVRRCCCRCAKVTRKGTFTNIGEAVVEGLYTLGGRLCHDHTAVYTVRPCAGCGHTLFALQGPRHLRGRLIEGAEYVTKTGQVVRECPGCGGALDGAALAAEGEAR